MQRSRIDDAEAHVPNGRTHQTWRSRRRFMDHVTYMPAVSRPETDHEEETHGVVGTNSISLLNRVQPVRRMTEAWEAKLDQENSAAVHEAETSRKSWKYQQQQHGESTKTQEQFGTQRQNVQVQYWRSKKTFNVGAEERVEPRKSRSEVLQTSIDSNQMRNHGGQGQGAQRDSYIESEHIRRLLRDSGDYTSQPPVEEQGEASPIRTSPEVPSEGGDCTVVDKWYMSCESGSVLIARRVVKKDGSPVGLNEATLTCVVKAMKNAEFNEGHQPCLQGMPNEFRRHYNTFFSDKRVVDGSDLPAGKNGSKESWWWDSTLASLKLRTPLTISPELKVQDAIDIMKRKGFDQIPVVDRNGGILGMVTLGSLLTCILHNKLGPVESALDRQFKKVHLNWTLGQLTHILKTDHYVLVTHSHIECSEHGEKEKEVIIGVVTQMDLLNYITGLEHDNQGHNSSYKRDSQIVAIPEP